ncbi:hypothetical protein DPMN_109262 [Dreissena polymorpha]|uniref:Uncharacterized protein n=1 Tax=Dreissena polymorpha TaxID=45954 RepID=A0A9D4KAF8_DREPO|nr:hypothetical protein DPMN_109262 [Dreissena polymorpha]
MQNDLGGEEVAQGVDPATGHLPTEKGQPHFIRELQHHQLHQQSLQVMLPIILT